jgi:hypothetical protein
MRFKIGSTSDNKHQCRFLVFCRDFGEIRRGQNSVEVDVVRKHSFDPHSYFASEFAEEKQLDQQTNKWVQFFALVKG